ncbi:MAG: sigma-70 family RNA polymerase sigma factor [Opitutus sp.]|nr:sigma-70 family RNA polymerase sigma factor [Opitutus sp.]
MIDDAELLRRYAAEKSEAAFAEFVRRQIGLVYAAASRRLGGDTHGAADVTQQVFIAALRHARELARHPGVTGWLYTTTRHAAIDHLRNEQRRRQREHEAHAMSEILGGNGPLVASDRDTTEATHAWEQLRPVLDGAMDALSAADRKAVFLRFFEGQAFAEIGRRLQLTENAARMRVERALDKLQALLAQRGVTSTAAALGVVLANQVGVASAAVPVGLAGSVTNAALASATVASVAAPLAGVLGFMSTAKIAVTIGAMLSMAGAGSALYENGHAREAESTLAAMRRERDALQARMAALARDARGAEQQARTSEERAAALQTEVATTRAAKEASRPATESFAAAISGSAGSVNPGMEMLANPEYVRLSVEKYCAGLGLQFAPLYKLLKLSPEQIAKFEANRTEFQQVTQEVWSAAVAKGVSVSDPAMASLLREPVTNLEKDLIAMFGETGYKQYQQYNRAQSGLDVVNTLAGNLYRTDTPLNGQQGDQLVQAVMNNTRTVPTAPGSIVMRNETDWAAVAAHGQGVLAPPQAAVFEAVIAGKKLQQQMNAISSAMRAAPNAKPGGG